MCVSGWWIVERLMFEVTETGGYHSHVMGVAVIDRFVVADRASGMDYGSDASLVGYLHAVSEGEEGIRSHDGSVEVVAE